MVLVRWCWFCFKYLLDVIFCLHIVALDIYWCEKKVILLLLCMVGGFKSFFCIQFGNYCLETSWNHQLVKPYSMNPDRCPKKEQASVVHLSLRIQSPCQMMIGVYNRLLSKVFRFHYHSQKVIGSLGCCKSFGFREYQGIYVLGLFYQWFPSLKRQSRLLQFGGWAL